MNRQLIAPVSRPSGRSATYAEFVRGTWGNAHVEWVNGEVIDMPAVDLRHADLNDFLRALVRLFVELRKLGTVLSEPFNMYLPSAASGRAPDLMFISKAHSRRIRDTHLEGPADLVVEIVSPGSRAVDRGEKFYEYESGGVREFWLIDRPRRQAEFFSLTRRGKLRIYQPIPVDEAGIFRSEVLKPFWLKVDWLWQRPLRPVLDVLNEINAPHS